MADLKTVLSEAVAAAFAAEGVDTALARVTPSDRPDLADFQSNGALAAAKALCTNAAVGAADQAARVLGGAALSPQLPFERLLRDARAGLTHPPTDAEAFERLGGALLDAERRETQVP